MFPGVVFSFCRCTQLSQCSHIKAKLIVYLKGVVYRHWPNMDFSLCESIRQEVLSAYYELSLIQLTNPQCKGIARVCCLNLAP